MHSPKEITKRKIIEAVCALLEERGGHRAAINLEHEFDTCGCWRLDEILENHVAMVSGKVVPQCV